MKSSETDILVIPGYEGAGPVHWQTRMVGKLSTARIVDQPDWLHSSLTVAVAQIVKAVDEATRPIVFVAHSLGNLLVAQSVPALTERGLIGRVKGAYLVAVPVGAALLELAAVDKAFGVIPRDPLPFPSVLVASSNDPFASLEEAADISAAWGSKLIEAGEQGHINIASGHGPWPEGMMSFAGFLSRLQISQT
jgi:uncharacterized protein